jgi:3-phytase
MCRSFPWRGWSRWTRTTSLLPLLAAVTLLQIVLGCDHQGSADAVSEPPKNVVSIEAAYGTAALSADPDDPAIWVHPTEERRSLIIGTMKVAAPAGAIVVFGLDGQIRQLIPGIDRPNNVDVEYGFPLSGRSIDLVVATERLKRQLRVFAVDPAEGRLVDMGGIPILAGQEGENGAPMGIALYRRTRDNAMFVIVAPKAGPREGYLWQYQLLETAPGRIGVRFVRRFGHFSGGTVRAENEIEAVAVDDALGYVYYADEAAGIHKWHADPDRPDAGRELALFGQTGYRGDREGIAIYTVADGTGYVVCTDQLDGASEYHVYRREGSRENPHDHTQELAVFRGGADATDGLEISSQPLGPAFPHGVMVAMNSTARNFLVFDWQPLAAALRLPLRPHADTHDSTAKR